MGLAWGGHLNGRVSSGVHDAPNFRPLPGYMASVKNGSQALRTDAALQLSGLMQAFYRKFKVRLTLSEGYRNIDVQNEYWRRYQNGTGNLAAWPGTSIHGWALSADLAIEGGPRPTGIYLDWLRANAAKYGFVNDVASESWHWSYRTDLVTRSIVVKKYISNPNTIPGAPAKPKPPVKPKPKPKKVPTMLFTRSTKSGQYRVITDYEVQEKTKREAEAYSHSVVGEGHLFADISSEDAKILIADVAERRKSLGLAVSAAVTKALAEENK